MEDNIPQQQQQQPMKSTRTFEEWKASLIKIIANKHGKPVDQIKVEDERVRSYYDQALMPTVAFNELFNH
jgi:hypothetical protein